MVCKKHRVPMIKELSSGSLVCPECIMDEHKKSVRYVRCGYFVYLGDVIWGFFATEECAEIRKQQLIGEGASRIRVEEAFVRG